ncbi:hypothetical protein Taro_016173, partial [Colocasia esculenta]|nr:hypothetical protein [Colocasia esculenta]
LSRDPLLRSAETNLRRATRSSTHFCPSTHPTVVVAARFRREEHEREREMGMGRRTTLLLPVAALFTFLCCAHVARAQVPIPSRFDGFVYGVGAPSRWDSIVVDAFFDPLCPDSKDAWPDLRRAVEHYSPRVSLTVHPFALPYHDNSFVACRALHIADKLNASATYPLLELFFKYQDRYYNRPTRELSRASIVGKIAKLAAKAIGHNSSAIESGFEDLSTGMATRISFKYACSRGVIGTPSFFVNGFPLPDGGSAIDYHKWKSIIDPLLKNDLSPDGFPNPRYSIRFNTELIPVLAVDGGLKKKALRGWKEDEMEIMGKTGAVPSLRSALLFLALSCCCFHLGAAQVPIPAKYDGFVYQVGAPPGEGSVVVEAFFDPLCPDSRDAWPPLRRVIHEYSPRVFLVVHPFPLPYHDNSFFSCRALHIANKLNKSTTYPLLEIFFKYQEKLYNSPTHKMSRESVIQHVVDLAVEAVGNSSRSALENGFEDRRSDMAARISFKYGCSRGVVGTPFFFVNGFPLPDAGDALDYGQWRGIIDPLLSENSRVREIHPSM